MPNQVERALGGQVKALGSGIYRVRRANGDFSFTTHGPDYGNDLLNSFGAAGLGPGSPERAPVCATDYYQEILYGYPATATNELASKRAGIQAQIRRNNFLLNQESLASGGPTADFKVRCAPNGTIKVSAFPVVPDLAGGGASFARIVSAAKAVGFGATDNSADFTIFYDGPGSSTACRIASMHLDDSPGVNNLNNNPPWIEPGYGVTYSGCWFSPISMHENAHNQGAVQQNAPNSTGTGGHCNEQDDIMCYLDGGSTNQTMVPCPEAPGTLHYDCGWNTYFDSAPEPGEWLANHWNIGSPNNRFIAFGSAGAEPPETSVSAGPTGITNNAVPTFAFRSSGSSSTFECRFDSDTFDVCSGPGETHTPAAPLLDGPHTFEVRASDALGNSDPTPASVRFSIDTQAPDTRITVRPGATLRARQTRARATASFESNELGSVFECRLNGSPFTSCSSPHTWSGLQFGRYRLEVRAIDSAGNADATPAGHSFQVKKRKKRP